MIVQDTFIHHMAKCFFPRSLRLQNKSFDTFFRTNSTRVTLLRPHLHYVLYTIQPEQSTANARNLIAKKFCAFYLISIDFRFNSPSRLKAVFGSPFSSCTTFDAAFFQNVRSAICGTMRETNQTQSALLRQASPS